MHSLMFYKIEQSWIVCINYGHQKQYFAKKIDPSRGSKNVNGGPYFSVKLVPGGPNLS